jgi:hypothetical protein
MNIWRQVFHGLNQRWCSLLVAQMTDVKKGGLISPGYRTFGISVRNLVGADANIADPANLWIGPVRSCHDVGDIGGA